MNKAKLNGGHTAISNGAPKVNIDKLPRYDADIVRAVGIRKRRPVFPQKPKPVDAGFVRIAAVFGRYFQYGIDVTNPEVYLALAQEKKKGGKKILHVELILVERGKLPACRQKQM
ncbi:MAG: hypothetical protein V4467_02350 [Patescibacteria group bacterium]